MNKKTINKILIIIILVSNLTVFSQPGENDLDQKLMMGYQGWFLAQGDGSPVGDWRHWFQRSNDPSLENINIDCWPDLTEYTETHPTTIKYSDGSTAELFSSYNQSTTNLHFKWMQDYNIYGVYLQRFLGEATGDQRFFKVRNDILENVMNASKLHNRHYAVMYDLSGVNNDFIYDKLINDWEYLVDTYDMLNTDEYVKQDGRPVIAIWGIGFSDRGLDPEMFIELLDYFHNSAEPKYQAYVMGGVPGQWRTLDADSESDPRWTDVYHSLDMISPWTVGRYGDTNGADNWKNSRVVPDLNDCTENGVDYMPVIFPGFSWYNMHDGTTPLNQIPRQGGHFYWRQAFNAISAGAQFLYVAMFDEVDEGTAMFKLASKEADLPANSSFVSLDSEGYDVPSDWYLQVADKSQQMLDGTIALTNELPLSPQKIAVTNVIISDASAILAVGSVQQLSSTIEPAKAFDKNVIWSSSDDGVVSVTDKGKIEGISIGTAIVIVTSQDGGLKAECAVEVKEGKPVTDVKVTPNRASLDVGDTFQLTAVIEPADALNQTLFWQSRDEEIATVDSTGLVTAVAEGDAIISVITQDGSHKANARIDIIDSSQTSFYEEPLVIPGIIEAEDYDIGGEGVAYHDADSGNNGNAYRTDEDVDVQACEEGGFNLGWFNSGEWVEYTVNVLESGRYDIAVRVATEQNGGKFHIEFDERNKTGEMSVPNTGGWQSFETIVKENVYLSAGQQVMHVFRETDGSDFNINYFSIQTTGTLVSDNENVIKTPCLHPAFPNPFNATTSISFDVAQPTVVKIDVYDVLGRNIRTIVNEKIQTGRYTKTWDSKNNESRVVSTGVYFTRMQADDYVHVNKIILLK